MTSHSPTYQDSVDHEIESYDPATGELVAWVNVPSLSSLEDTYLYMYFGNREATNQQNSQAVWDSDYVLVQHLNETSGAHYDTTSYGNNGTPVSLADQDIVGQIDGADLFDDTGDKVNVGTDASLDVFGTDHDFSMTLWAQRDNMTTIHGFFASGSDFHNGIFFGTRNLNENDLKFMSKGNTLTFDSNADVFTIPDGITLD